MLYLFMVVEDAVDDTDNDAFTLHMSWYTRSLHTYIYIYIHTYIYTYIVEIKLKM